MQNKAVWWRSGAFWTPFGIPEVCGKSGDEFRNLRPPACTPPPFSALGKIRGLGGGSWPRERFVAPGEIRAPFSSPIFRAKATGGQICADVRCVHVRCVHVRCVQAHVRCVHVRCVHVRCVHVHVRFAHVRRVRVWCVQTARAGVQRRCARACAVRAVRMWCALAEEACRARGAQGTSTNTRTHERTHAHTQKRTRQQEKKTAKPIFEWERLEAPCMAPPSHAQIWPWPDEATCEGRK